MGRMRTILAGSGCLGKYGISDRTEITGKEKRTPFREDGSLDDHAVSQRID
jgi:hypothetical protein